MQSPLCCAGRSVVFRVLGTDTCAMMHKQTVGKPACKPAYSCLCLAEHCSTDAASACRVKGPSLGGMGSAPVWAFPTPQHIQPHPPAAALGL